MTQFCYFCCDKAEKAARFDLQQTMHSLDNAFVQRLSVEVLMIFSPGNSSLLKVSSISNVRKSEAKVNSKCRATDQKHQKMLSKYCFCGIRNSVANPPSAELMEKGRFCIKSIYYSAAREPRQMVMSACQPLPPFIAQNIPNIISFPFRRQTF